MVWKCICCCNLPKSVFPTLCRSVPLEAKLSDRQREYSNSLIFAFYPILLYKKFDLGISLRGAFGFEVLNEYRMHWETMKRISEGNLPKSVLKKPFGSQSYVFDSHMYHSYYVEKGDYVKLDNVTLGYTLNLNNKYLRSVRLYVTGHNLLTITGYDGLDPEVSIKGLDPGVERKELYPTVRSYTVGAIVKF